MPSTGWMERSTLRCWAPATVPGGTHREGGREKKHMGVLEGWGSCGNPCPPPIVGSWGEPRSPEQIPEAVGSSRGQAEGLASFCAPGRGQQVPRGVGWRLWGEDGCAPARGEQAHAGDHRGTGKPPPCRIGGSQGPVPSRMGGSGWGGKNSSETSRRRGEAVTPRPRTPVPEEKVPQNTQRQNHVREPLASTGGLPSSSPKRGWGHLEGEKGEGAHPSTR